jgi:diguanylate cyclase (GGDEF)-like protein
MTEARVQSQQELPLPRARILFLNHRRDQMRGILEALQQHGYEVAETQSIIETHRALAKDRPALIILNPLVLQPGSVELEVLEDLQHNDPVPVIMLLDSLADVRTPARSRLEIWDFITKPATTEEILSRIDRILYSRDHYLALHKRFRELEGQIHEDFKTGLLNDRHFQSVQLLEFKRAQRHTTPLSLLLVDVDDFKSVNDTTEYTFGDEVLQHVASCLKQTIRATDHAVRFGGDEFALLLPHTSPREAVQTANRVRKEIGGMEVTNGNYAKRVTVSIGISSYDGRSRSTAEELQRQANLALKEAKRLGKNQVWLHTETDEEST